MPISIVTNKVVPSSVVQKNSIYADTDSDDDDDFGVDSDDGGGIGGGKGVSGVPQSKTIPPK
jgi:hypothetical protein